MNLHYCSPLEDDNRYNKIGLQKSDIHVDKHFSQQWIKTLVSFLICRIADKNALRAFGSSFPHLDHGFEQRQYYQKFSKECLLKVE